LPVERQIEVCSRLHDHLRARLCQPPSRIEKQRRLRRRTRAGHRHVVIGLADQLYLAVERQRLGAGELPIRK
jgi:hypothetical protein